MDFFRRYTGKTSHSQHVAGIMCSQFRHCLLPDVSRTRKAGNKNDRTFFLYPILSPKRVIFCKRTDRKPNNTKVRNNFSITVHFLIHSLDTKNLKMLQCRLYFPFIPLSTKIQYSPRTNTYYLLIKELSLSFGQIQTNHHHENVSYWPSVHDGNVRTIFYGQSNW